MEWAASNNTAETMIKTSRCRASQVSNLLLAAANVAGGDVCAPADVAVQLRLGREQARFLVVPGKLEEGGGKRELEGPNFGCTQLFMHW